VLDSDDLTHVILIRLELQAIFADESRRDCSPLQLDALKSFSDLSLLALNKLNGGSMHLTLQRSVARLEGSRLYSYIYMRLDQPKFIDLNQMTDLKSIVLDTISSPRLEGLIAEQALRVDHSAQFHLELSRMRLLSDLRASDAAQKETVHYVVETDVESGWWDEITQWYEQEHLPGLASVPGCIVARRYLNLDAGPRSLACYDLQSEDVLASPPWLAVRATPWSSKARPHFVNTKRNVYPRVLL
jgi:hypothetical protein